MGFSDHPLCKQFRFLPLVLQECAERKATPLKALAISHEGVLDKRCFVNGGVSTNVWTVVQFYLEDSVH